MKTGKAHVLTSAECIKIMNQQQRKKKQEGNEKEESRKERDRKKIAKDELAQKKKTRTSSTTKEKTRSFPQKIGGSYIQEGCLVAASAGTMTKGKLNTTGKRSADMGHSISLNSTSNSVSWEPSFSANSVSTCVSGSLILPAPPSVSACSTLAIVTAPSTMSTSCTPTIAPASSLADLVSAFVPASSSQVASTKSLQDVSDVIQLTSNISFLKTGKRSIIHQYNS